MNYTTVYRSVAQYPDGEVIKGILSGNKSLFEILIRRYNPDLYKIGRGYGYNHQDTEDLMQEVFINSFQSLAKFQNRSSFKTWLIRIMLNECYHKSKSLAIKKSPRQKYQLTKIQVQCFLLLIIAIPAGLLSIKN